MKCRIRRSGNIMKINGRIRQLRKKNNMTSKVFGNIFNISESSVSLYESGKRRPSIELLIKISNYFNVSTDYLLGITDAPYCYSQKQNNDYAVKLKLLINDIDNEDDSKIFNGKVMDINIKNIYKNSLINTYEILSLLTSYYNVNNLIENNN